MSYRVFLNAPTAASLEKRNREEAFSWFTATSGDEERLLFEHAEKVARTSNNNEKPSKDFAHIQVSQYFLIPPGTLDAASQRISEMYKNVIFTEVGEDEQEWDRFETTRDNKSEFEDEESLIPWPPTNAQSQIPHSLSRLTNVSAMDSREYSEDTSYAHTSTSSITAFPTFVINLHTLTALPDIMVGPMRAGKWTRKIHLLVAILEVDGPDLVRIKKGPDAGRDVPVLRLVVGSEEGGMYKLTAWRESAELWGGTQEPDDTMLGYGAVKKGDIVYLESILASSSNPTSNDPGQPSVISLTASPNLGSCLHVCYRSLPTAPSDRRFRPDLRLAASDPGLRKVASVVHWFESMTGVGTTVFGPDS